MFELVATLLIAQMSWKDYLPTEDWALRAKFTADPYLNSFLGSAVFVTVDSDKQLLNKGFFINNGWAYNGIGIKPSVTQIGSCSPISRTQFICGSSSMTPNWGIQDKKAQERLIRIAYP